MEVEKTESKEVTNEVANEIGGNTNNEVFVNEPEIVHKERLTETLVETSNTFNTPSTFSGHTPSVIDNFNLLERTSQQLENMTNIANVLVKSGLCPLKHPSDVVLAIITGNQYNFPFMTSINNIYPVNGRPSMSAHLIRALIITNQIVFNKVYNAEPIYLFAQTDDNGDIIVLTEGTSRKPKAILGQATKDTIIPNAKPILSKVVDKITKYVFRRKIRLADGSWETINVVSEFKMSDAVQAGLADKDNWSKHPDRMLDARAFTIGAREIAPDKLLGIYSIGELADTNNVQYTMDDSFIETVVQQ